MIHSDVASQVVCVLLSLTSNPDNWRADGSPHIKYQLAIVSCSFWHLHSDQINIDETWNKHQDVVSLLFCIQNSVLISGAALGWFCASAAEILNNLSSWLQVSLITFNQVKIRSNSLSCFKSPLPPPFSSLKLHTDNKPGIDSVSVSLDTVTCWHY